MTGYGRAEGTAGKYALSVEITSVNKKHLDIQVSLPRDLQMLERDVSEVVRSHFQRGTLKVCVQLRPAGESPSDLWDASRVQAAVEALSELGDRVSIPFRADSELLLRIAQMVGQEGTLPDADAVRAALKPLLAQALDELAGMRSVEGDALREDLLSRVAVLEAAAARVRTAAESTVPRYREALLERLRQAKLELDLSDDRVLRELALFADRADITEELTRLESHCAQFREFARSGEPIGRKMDFLCQELHREVNTIGSKANNLDVTREVLDMKNEVERIREQVQNVE